MVYNCYTGHRRGVGPTVLNKLFTKNVVEELLYCKMAVVMSRMQATCNLGYTRPIPYACRFIAALIRQSSAPVFRCGAQ